MESQTTDERSRQTRIADDLRALIAGGEYPAGAQLPTYESIAFTYSCSLGVARKAVDLLRQQGLVVTRQGKGLFVREKVSAKRHGIERYAKSRWKHGGTPIHDAEAGSQGLSVRQIYREIGEVPALPSVAEAFGIPVGDPVAVRRRTTIVAGRPHQLADSYFPVDLARGTRLMEENSGPGGGFARLDEAGDPLAEISETWSARMPLSPESVALDLPPGTPVFDLTRITYDSEGRAVEVMLAVIAADTVTLHYKFAIPDED
jgi:GntR family transcriptional regulator